MQGYRPEDPSMKINPRARIDPGRVRIRRGGGGGGLPMGGGGGGGFPIPLGGGVGGIVVVIILLVLLSQCGGLSLLGGDTGSTQSDAVANCETGADAQNNEDCKLSLFVSAIERFWEKELPAQTGVEYTP